MIENPVTAESKNNKIEQLEYQLKAWKSLAESLGRFRKSVLSAGFFTRLKWVFTGVKF